MSKVVGVGIVGAGGVALVRHLPGYQEAAQAGEARVVAIYDVDIARAREVAAANGIAVVCQSEHELLAREDVDAVSICTPNYLHYPQVLAALQAQKHVLCEKPLAMNLGEAEEMVRAATEVGVVTAVNFRYRWIPAARFVSQLISEGRLGRVYHGIFHYLTSMLADPGAPVSWRTTRAHAGSGALGDLGSHLIDLAATWLGDARSVQADLPTFVPERRATDGGVVEIDVDDAAGFNVHYSSGAVGQFLATRSALGRVNYQRIELYGSEGAVSYEFDKWDRGADRVRVCLGHQQGRFGGFSETQVWPEHLLGTPTGPIHEFIRAIREDRPASPSFADGFRCQQVMAAVEQSARSGMRVAVGAP